MSYITLPEDSRMRTYIGSIVPNENWPIALETMEFLGHWKRVDFDRAHGTNLPKDRERLTATERRKFLQEQGITDSCASAIVRDNDDQNALMWRTHKDNRREWHKDVAEAKRKPKNRRLQDKAEQAKKNLENPIRITFGTRSLWRQAQTDPAKMEEFKQRRMWMGGIGRSDYYSPKIGVTSNYWSNQTIRVDDDLNVWINIPPALRAKYGLTKSTCWINVGQARMKNGRETLVKYRNEGRSVTYHIQFLDRKWKLRANLQLDPIEKVSGPRILSPDVNVGHIDYSIVDLSGNPCGKPVTVEYKSKKDIPAVLDQIAADAAKRGVTGIGIEQLAGMQRRKGAGRSRATNRKVSSIPSGAIKRELQRICENRGWELLQCDPAGTSANAPQWADIVQSDDEHQIASYLIGRKALGHSIARENHRVIKQRRDSGRSAADIDEILGDWLIGGEDDTGDDEAVNGFVPPI